MHKFLYFLFMLAVFFLSDTIMADQDYSDRTTVVLIGVSKTDGNSFSELPFVTTDIEQLLRVFNNYQNSQTFVLANEDPVKKDSLKVQPLLNFENNKIFYYGCPTKENIEKLLREACDGSNQNGTLIVYFSGHGLTSSKDGQKSLLIASDTKRTFNGDTAEESTTVSVYDIRKTLESAKSTRKIFLLDACHSGGTRGSSLQKKLSAELAVSEIDGVLTLASCRADQNSGPLNDGVMSLFTYWLCKGLKGYADGFADYDEDKFYDKPDGITDTLELVNYINDNIKIYMKAQGITYDRKNRQDVVLVASKNTFPFNLPKIKTPSINEILDDFTEQIVTHVQSDNIDTFDYSDFQSEFLAQINTENSTTDYETPLKITENTCNDYLNKDFIQKLRTVKTNVLVTKNSKAIKGGDFRTLQSEENSESNEKIKVSLKNKIIYENNNSKNGYYFLYSTLQFSDDTAPLTLKRRVLNIERIMGQPPRGTPINASSMKTNQAGPATTVTPQISGDKPEGDTPGPVATEESAPFNRQIENNISSIVPRTEQPNDPSVILPEIYFEIKNHDGTISRRNFFRIGDALYIPFNEGEVYRIIFNCAEIQKDKNIGLRVLIDGKNTIAQEKPKTLKGVYPPTSKLRIADPKENSNRNTKKINYTPNGRIIETPVLVNSGSDPQIDHPSGRSSKDAAIGESSLCKIASEPKTETKTETTSKTETVHSETTEDTPLQEDQGLVVAPNVQLNSARFWILKNNEIPQAIEGFYKNVNYETGVSEYNEFTVTNVPSKIAEPGFYSSDMGIITIAFYDLVKSEAARGSTLRTMPGKLFNNIVPIVNGFECGKAHNIIHIRYASESAIKAFMNSQTSQKYEVVKKGVTKSN